MDLPMSRAVSFRLGLGGGTDLVRAETQAPPGYVPEHSHVRAFGVGRVSAGLEARVAASLLLWLNAAADLDPSSTTYVIDARAAETLVLRPWAVRPAVAVGAAFP